MYRVFFQRVTYNPRLVLRGNQRRGGLLAKARGIAAGPARTPPNKPEPPDAGPISFRGSLIAIAFFVLAGAGCYDALQYFDRKLIYPHVRLLDEWLLLKTSPKYGRLNDDEIRLLVLEPGAPGSPIRCTLVENVPVDNPGDFEALSYVWGDAYDRRRIKCNGTTIRISRSLYEALCQLRYPDKERVIWADALCINQHDQVEKGTQLPLMGRIYEMSSRVLIWLGHPTERTQSALATLREADNYLADQLKHYRAWREHATKTGCSSYASSPLGLLTSHKMQLSRQQIAHLDTLDWPSIHELMTHPWFRRVWVYQEFSKASQPVLVLGSDELSLKTVFRCIATLDLQGERIGQVRLSEETSKSIWALRRSLYREARITSQEDKAAMPQRLLDLVLDGLLREATDDRDRIYAFHDLADDVGASDWEVMPDYTVPVEEVYKRFARWCLLRKGGGSGNLEFLQLCNADYENLSDRVLPSWARDWKVAVPVLTFPERRYHASPKAEATVLWRPDQPDTLNIKGVLVDRVKDLAISPMQLFFLEKTENNLGARFGSRSFNEVRKTNPSTFRQLQAAADARQRFSTNRVPNHDRGAVVWMEQCKHIASGGTGRFPPPKLKAFLETMMANNSNSKLKPTDFLSFMQLLSNIRDGSKTTLPQPGLMFLQPSESDRYVAPNHRDPSSAPARRPNPFSARPRPVQPFSFSHAEAIERQHDNKLRADIDVMMTPFALRRFCSTKQGRLGWVPVETRPEDVICVFEGGNVPFVLRPQPLPEKTAGRWNQWLRAELGLPLPSTTRSASDYRLIGECYLHGMMDGQVAQLKDAKARFIRII